jgi:hypothetical protein
MSTRIYFAGTRGDKPVTLTVDDDLHTVGAGLASGTAFLVNDARQGEIYVNPGNVLYALNASKPGVASF